MCKESFSYFSYCCLCCRLQSFPFYFSAKSKSQLKETIFTHYLFFSEINCILTEPVDVVVNAVRSTEFKRAVGKQVGLEKL